MLVGGDISSRTELRASAAIASAAPRHPLVAETGVYSGAGDGLQTSRYLEPMQTQAPTKATTAGCQVALATSNAAVPPRFPGTDACTPSRAIHRLKIAGCSTSFVPAEHPRRRPGNPRKLNVRTRKPWEPLPNRHWSS